MTDPQHDPLDAWLDGAQEVEPSALLRRSIAEIPLRHPRAAELHTLWPFGNAWRAISMAIVICAFGVIAGAGSVDLTNDDDDSHESGDDLALALAVDIDSDIDEVLTP